MVTLIYMKISILAYGKLIKSLFSPAVIPH